MSIIGKLDYCYHEIKTKSKHYYQKLRYGVSDYECWGLNYTLASYILPRLKHFKKMKRWGYPASITSEQWEQEIDDMIFAFDFHLRENEYLKFPINDETIEDIFSRNKKRTPEQEALVKEFYNKHNELYARQDKGFKLFGERFGTLWD